MTLAEAIVHLEGVPSTGRPTLSPQIVLLEVAQCMAGKTLFRIRYEGEEPEHEPCRAPLARGNACQPAARLI